MHIKVSVLTTFLLTLKGNNLIFIDQSEDGLDNHTNCKDVVLVLKKLKNRHNSFRYSQSKQIPEALMMKPSEMELSTLWKEVKMHLKTEKESMKYGRI